MDSSRLSKNKYNDKVKIVKKDYRLLDSAWDKFSEYIGEHELQTPISVSKFEEILKEIDTDKKFEPIKEHILYSLQYECYSWPLVEREKVTR